EELRADLAAGDGAGQLLQQPAGLLERVHVQRDEHAIADTIVETVDHHARRGDGRRLIGHTVDGGGVGAPRAHRALTPGRGEYYFPEAPPPGVPPGAGPRSRRWPPGRRRR